MSISMPGLSKLRQAIGLLPAQLVSQETVALSESLALLGDTIHREIPVGAGQHGFHARDQVFTSVAAGQPLTGSIYTIAPQLGILERGSPPHVIKPVAGQALHLSSGAFAAVVHHPGQRALRIFATTLAALRSTISNRFTSGVQRAVDQLARSVR